MLSTIEGGVDNKMIKLGPISLVDFCVRCFFFACHKITYQSNTRVRLRK